MDMRVSKVMCRNWSWCMVTPEKVENEVLIGSYMISVLPPQKLKMKEQAQE